MRDLLILVTFVTSIQFFFIDPFIEGAWPLTGGLAADCALAVLVIKLIWDADDDPKAFYAVTGLLVLGSMLYLVPTFIGVQASDFSSVSGISTALISSNHPVLAAAMAYVSMTIAGILGLIAVGYVIFFHATVAPDLPEMSEGTAGGS